MAKEIDNLRAAQELLFGEVRKQEADLAKRTRATGKEQQVIAKASQRDRLKFIPRRLS